MKTHVEMMKVHKDPSFTTSQKLQMLFADAETKSIQDEIQESIPTQYQNLQVVGFSGNGEWYILKDTNNKFYLTNTGNLDDEDNLIVEDVDADLDESQVYNLWASLLYTSDVDEAPLFFYDGQFIDEDLQDKFLSSIEESSLTEDIVEYL